MDEVMKRLDSFPARSSCPYPPLVVGIRSLLSVVGSAGRQGGAFSVLSVLDWWLEWIIFAAGKRIPLVIA